MVVKTDTCWLWQGALTTHGYGQMRWRGKQTGAHRIAWWLETGEMPELDVLHRCDAKPCVKFADLFLGTNRDNIDDMIAKGRQNKGRSHPAVKLFPEQVIVIREGERFAAARRLLASRFGVSVSTIEAIQYGRIWRHLE